MSIPSFYSIPFGGVLMLTKEKNPIADRFFRWHNSNGEPTLWVGRLQIVYTPRNWKQRHAVRHHEDRDAPV